MFRSIDRSPRRRNRAVTLIEAVLYISIALALIVGGLVFFQQASTAARTSTMVRQSSAMLAEARILMKGLPADTEWLPITSTLIAAGAVPPDMVTSPTTLSNPFGGLTTVDLAMAPDALGTVILRITSRLVPQGVCARLLTASSGSDYVLGGVGATTLVSSGYIFGGALAVGGSLSVKPWAMNATQAGWMCKYGSLNYTDKNSEPNTPPISGTVTVTMLFLINA